MEGCAMGQVLHGSARTTAAVRRAIQQSQESLRSLAKRHGINPKTVAKWKTRGSVADQPTGPKQPRSTVLSIEEEAIIVGPVTTKVCKIAICGCAHFRRCSTFSSRHSHVKS